MAYYKPRGRGARRVFENYGMTVEPYSMKAKYHGKCGCGQEILPGQLIGYFPRSRSVECEACWLKTLALRDDEREYERRVEALNSF